VSTRVCDYDCFSACREFKTSWYAATILMFEENFGVRHETENGVPPTQEK